MAKQGPCAANYSYPNPNNLYVLGYADAKGLMGSVIITYPNGHFICTKRGDNQAFSCAKSSFTFTFLLTKSSLAAIFSRRADAQSLKRVPFSIGRRGL
jgi:hypothetical protein